MSELRGQCLCGAVTVTATPERESVSACHCEMCQRWGSGPFLSFQAAPGYAALGPVQTYQSSGWAERAFCSKCGASLWYRMTSGEHKGQTQMSAGLFENAGGNELRLELYIDKKPEGYAFDSGSRKLTGADVIDMFAPSGEGISQ
ncbi:GFA family protein [Leisingera sp. ANG-Vp]|uniref:GFA family protein n=1 Tax=Leisingera sp. ANG-Vp TaxID=1577896 RepID=UPI00057D5DD6|nr:GFA family protein [Leisingera sp. ANG-Vp]KIC13446.1 aldehyde-activating protein [Leisingera sp. ANG-Vp]